MLSDLEYETRLRVLDAVCKVLEYDPAQGQYSKAKLQELAEKRRSEAAARGVSTYELVRKAYYTKNKERINKQRSDAYHAKKLALTSNLTSTVI